MQVLIASLITFLTLTQVAYATPSVNELRTKIDGNRGEIQKIEAEIKKYERDLTKVQGEKRTLQNSVYTLDLSRKKTSANIQLTEGRIARAKKKILSLADNILDHISQIKNGSAGLAQALRRMNEADDNTFIEVFLKNDNLANAWTATESLRQFQSVVGERVSTLEEKRKELEDIKDSKEAEKRVLSTEKDALASDKRALDINRDAKNRLLRTTKNKESEYQKILAAKRKAKKDFELQMAAFEAQLKFILDKNSIPEQGSSIFSWPTPKPYITQYFGNTKFAKSGAYNGRGHNGLDLRAPVGTRINAALGGIVQDTNEKVAANCQYGKWILIKHGNGLTTLYAHLSSISVSKGQAIVSGQRIGFSGETGYAFGPHLHLTTYASDAVKFKQYKCNSGPTVKVPVAAYSGYLNPLDYL